MIDAQAIVDHVRSMGAIQRFRCLGHLDSPRAKRRRIRVYHHDSASILRISMISFQIQGLEKQWNFPWKSPSLNSPQNSRLGHVQGGADTRQRRPFKLARRLPKSLIRPLLRKGHLLPQVGEGSARRHARFHRGLYATAVAPRAPRITTNQGGVRQNTRSKKARTPSPKSAALKIALVQTGV